MPDSLPPGMQLVFKSSGLSRKIYICKSIVSPPIVSFTCIMTQNIYIYINIYVNILRHNTYKVLYHHYRK